MPIACRNNNFRGLMVWLPVAPGIQFPARPRLLDLHNDQTSSFEFPAHTCASARPSHQLDRARITSIRLPPLPSSLSTCVVSISSFSNPSRPARHPAWIACEGITNRKWLSSLQQSWYLEPEHDTDGMLSKNFVPALRTSEIKGRSEHLTYVKSSLQMRCMIPTSLVRLPSL